MKLLKLTMIIPLIFLSSMCIGAQPRAIISAVPFENVFLIPNVSIVANFAFGSHKIIFCFENNLQTVGVITWPLFGQRASSSLPIFLKINNAFQGSLSDATGFLTITNTTKQTLVVSCSFGF